MIILILILIILVVVVVVVVVSIIMPGMADLTSQPFSNQSPWGGHWGGNGWRQNREFVGRLTYGIK